ncbi:hypothetical protein [Mesorhizobium sp. M1142]|uniref:hypothetical protein n=1 Tax=Mesorhizobium sp. M1142 TaxID=2957060 RepID=UPI003335C817
MVIVLLLWVPAIHRLLARNWNLASSGWPATALMVARRVGVSTPFLGSRGAFFMEAFSMTIVSSCMSFTPEFGFCATGIAPHGQTSAVSV